jgi:succinoglycan biosynthesis protein ExoM
VILSVCIATYKRLDRLDALLGDLERQELLPDEIIIVDNDASGSARAVVEARRGSGYPLTIHYEVQPERNISLTRNRTVHLASGDWLAFVDDDERAPTEWLRRLMEAAKTFSADAVLAPVEPRIPESAPRWIHMGRFYEWPRLASGTVVPDSNMRFGNVLLRGTVLRAEPGPFDPAFRLSTGEDGDMLLRLRNNRNARIVWCDDAPVQEPVEPKRLSLRWLLQRALSGGQHFARLAMEGRYRRVGPLDRALMLLQWGGQLVLAAVLALVSLPFGRHRAAAWLIKSSANLGKLTALVGWRYGEYA